MEIETIHKALKVLAGVCDFAQAPDGVGYNAFDTVFGHDLATRDTLTSGQAVAALKMLRKYSAQLSQAGIILPDSVPQVGPRVEIIQGMIAIFFGGKPSEEERNWLKSHSARWNPGLDGMPWTCSMVHLDEINNRYGTQIVAPVVQAQEQQTHPITPGKSDVRIEESKKGLLVYFENPDGRKERVELIKSLPQRKWLPDEPGTPWLVPARFSKELSEWFPTAKGIEKIQQAVEKTKQLIELSGQAEGEISIPGLTGTLYPFQQVGVKFLDTANGRGIVADEMGLGKTIQAIGYLALHTEIRPAVIIVPASLKSNWIREINKWLPVARVAQVNGTKTFNLELTGAEIIVINYDILKNWTEEIIRFAPKIVIADEAHYCKNSKSLRSQAMAEIAKKISQVILLTGTPVTNRPIELYPLLKMVDPSAWGNFMAYAKRYCNAHSNGFGWDFSGASNLEELNQVIKPYMIRRRKSQVLKELPPKVWANVIVDFDEQLQDEYDQMVELAQEEIAHMDSAQQLVIIEKMKQISVKAKLPGIINWIKDFIESGEKLVVFVTHKSTAAALENAFPEIHVTVTGDTPIAKRQECVDRFQTDPSITLFIGNTQAAGVGLTLTAASNVAFAEFPWTPGDLSQAADRCHRIGQTDSVTCWMLIGDKTIDEDITALLEEKRQVIETIHDGEISKDYKFGILQEVIKRITSKKS